MCIRKEKNECIIQRIAFRIYQHRMRNNIPGNDKQDWNEAEREYDKNNY